MVLGHPSSSALSTPPITSSRISTQQTTRHTRRGRAGARGTTSSQMTTGRAPELRPPKSACSGDAVLRTSTRVTVPMGQCAAPAPGAQSPWDSTLGNIEDSISQCTFLQMTYTAENQPAARPVTGTRLTYGCKTRLSTQQSYLYDVWIP